MKIRTIILILGAGLLLRAGFLRESYRHNPTFFTPIIDSHTYDDLARAAAAGEGMGPESVWQPLFYPYFLAAVYRGFGRDLILIRIIQILAGMGTLCLTFLLGKELFSPAVGAIAAGVVAFSGPLIFYEGEMLTGVWEVFWFLFSLFCFVRLDLRIRRMPEAKAKALGYERGGGPRLKPWATWVGMGVICGVGVVIRPTVLTFYLLAALWLLFNQVTVGRRGWARAIASGLGFVLGLALILGPVVIRNHRVTGYPILMPTSGGLNFYIGNNPRAAETIVTRPGEGWRQLTVLSREAGIHHQPYGSKFFYDQTFNYIRSRPFSFLLGLAEKTALFFHGREVPRNLDIYLFRDYSRVIWALVWRAGNFAFPMGILIPFALLGMLLCLRQWRKLFLLYLFAGTYSFAIILFFVTSRYRLPLIPVFGLFAAAAAARLYRLFRDRRFSLLVPALAALALLFYFSNRPLAIPEDRVDFQSELEMSLGSVHLREGDRELAEERLLRALETNPKNSEAHYLLGTLLFAAGRFEEAEVSFREAVRLHPEHSRAHQGLGEIYGRRGDRDRAREHWEAAARYDSGNPEIRKSLAELYEAEGEESAALREYWTALRLKPDDVPLRRRLAFIHADSGDWETARELIAEALRHHPEDPTLLSDLGVIYVNTGRIEEAVDLFERALELDPELTPARFNLELIRNRIETIEKTE